MGGASQRMLAETASLTPGEAQALVETLPADDALPPRPQLGARLGRYEIRRRLGQGGMGVVHEAFDPELDRPVALKVLHAELDVAKARRLRREAQAMAQLSHPHVVEVYEAGRIDGRSFIVMELVRGQTLRQWMEQRPAAGWRACVEVFLQVGEGLRAAHDQGLVHRDFKPSNAIIDHEGRARVLDFGLAKWVGDLDVPSMPTPRAEAELASEETSPTRTGAVAGTPAYMPLEQMLGLQTDARGDQFSFCVSLYEAIYGERPYAGDSLPTLMSAMMDERIRPAPASPAIPRRLRRVLLRGLAPRPEKRWASMAALMHQLHAVLQPRRRTWPLLGVVATVALAAAAVPRSDAEGPRCETWAQLAGVWDDTERQRIHDAILGTERLHAPATWAQVERGLDAYAAEWTELRTEACEASARSDGSASGAALGKLECLDDRRAALDALVDVLGTADATVVAHARSGLDALPPLAGCTDVDRLREDFQSAESRDVPQRTRVLRNRLTGLRSLLAAGQYERVITETTALFGAIEQLGLDPTLAHAHGLLGKAHARLARYERAEAHLHESYFLAQRLGHDRLAADAANTLAYVIGERLGRPEDGMEWVSHSCAASRRLGDPESAGACHGMRASLLSRQGLDAEASPAFAAATEALESAGAGHELELASVLDNHGLLLHRQGELPEALATMRRALRIREQTLGLHHPDVATSLDNIGQTLQQQGKVDLALDHHRRALEIRREALGSRHPDVATATSNLGVALYKAGRFEQALDHYQRARELREAALGAEHRSTATAIDNVAGALFSLGRHEEADPHFERALRIRERLLAPDDLDLAASLHNSASNLRALGQPTRALERLDRSLSIRRSRLGDEHFLVGATLTVRGDTLAAMGRTDDARPLYERALSIYGNRLGTRHAYLAYPSLGLARVAMHENRAATAAEHAQRAVDLREASPTAPDERAEAHFVLARALWRQGASTRPRARELARLARDEYTEAGERGEAQRARIEAWLAARPD